MPVDRLSATDESVLRGVLSRSLMVSSWIAPGGVNGGAGATVPFRSEEAGWARATSTELLEATIPLRGSALWDLKSGRSDESTDGPLITSTPGISRVEVGGFAKEDCEVRMMGLSHDSVFG